MAESLHLNWHVGGWKHPGDMVQETFPFFGTSATEVNKALTIAGYFDRPARAVDSCFNTAGQLMHAGSQVCNGILDRRAAGACTQAFPLYGTSRIVAGAPIEAASTTARARR